MDRHSKLNSLRRFSRIKSTGILILSDMTAILLSSALALVIWSYVNETLVIANYASLIPLVFVFIVVFVLAGLYPGIGVSAVEELRRLVLAITVVFLGMATVSFYLRNIEAYSRASFGLAWFFSLFMVPFFRDVVRSVASKKGWWGEPVAIIGYGPHGYRIYQQLKENPKLGLKPVLIINGFGKKHLEHVEVPICDAENLLKDTQIEEMKGIHTAILVTSEIPPDFLNSIIEEHWSSFAHLVMVSFDHQVGSVWITPYDMGGILGLEVRQNLLSDLQQQLKRAMDYFIILLFSPLLLPLISLLALLIKLDSPGSVFYNQYRLGQYGKKIKVWKFRTMVSDADQVLEHYLKLHPDYRQEWEANHKIKNDPRVTRVGKVLRRFSLDELPQLWNVLSGEMSMVGPRPIVDDEKKYYASCLRLYMQVKPGLTGLWQVSGRNDVSYEKRVQLDEYYVRNWSIWLDLYILARTFFAILGGKGAY